MDLKKMNFKFIEVPLNPIFDNQDREYYANLREPLKELRLCLESEGIYLTRNDLLKMLDIWFQIIYLGRTMDSDKEEISALVGYNPNYMDFNLNIFTQFPDSKDYERNLEFEKRLVISRFGVCDSEVNYSLPNIFRVIETGKLFLLFKELTIFVDDLLKYIAIAFEESSGLVVHYWMPMDDNWSRVFEITPIDLKIIKPIGYLVHSSVMTKKSSKEIQICYDTFIGKKDVEGTEANIIYKQYLRKHPTTEPIKE